MGATYSWTFKLRKGVLQQVLGDVVDLIPTAYVVQQGRIYKGAMGRFSP